MMDRRTFLMNVCVGLTCALCLPRLIPNFRATTSNRVRSIGGWDVDKNGQCSLGGQTKFPCYGSDGGISNEFVTVHLVGDKLEQRKHKLTPFTPDTSLGYLPPGSAW
jgi:hypothetical protein